MEERVKFYEEQLERLKEDLKKDETFQDTQRYTNYMGIETQLNNLVNQIKSMIKANEDAKLRELENQGQIAE